MPIRRPQGLLLDQGKRHSLSGAPWPIALFNVPCNLGPPVLVDLPILPGTGRTNMQPTFHCYLAWPRHDMRTSHLVMQHSQQDSLRHSLDLFNTLVVNHSTR